MFKVGDIVRINTDFFPSGYNNQCFRIIRFYMSDTHKREVFVIVGLNGGNERHFLPESLEKDTIYYRKQKIKKICSKLEI